MSIYNGQHTHTSTRACELSSNRSLAQNPSVKQTIHTTHTSRKRRVKNKKKERCKEASDGQTSLYDPSRNSHKPPPISSQQTSSSALSSHDLHNETTSSRTGRTGGGDGVSAFGIRIWHLAYTRTTHNMVFFGVFFPFPFFFLLPFFLVASIDVLIQSSSMSFQSNPIITDGFRRDQTGSQIYTHTYIV